MDEFSLWHQFTANQLKALHKSKLLKKFTPEQKARIQFTQRLTMFEKPVALRAFSEALGRPITGDEAGLSNAAMLQEYLKHPGKTLPSIEQDLLALIPPSKWYLVGIKQVDKPKTETDGK